MSGSPLTVLSVTAPAGNYRAGAVVLISVTFSEPVSLLGSSPSLDLNAGAASLLLASG